MSEKSTGNLGSNDVRIWRRGPGGLNLTGIGSAIFLGGAVFF